MRNSKKNFKIFQDTGRGGTDIYLLYSYKSFGFYGTWIVLCCKTLVGQVVFHVAVVGLRPVGAGVTPSVNFFI